ncbi:MAG: hotdog fold thioesterase [Thermodesulfobacteria bacterium]|nr:hotdog fold thioesterase [Thermodesulfobacteriota bacterium]
MNPEEIARFMLEHDEVAKWLKVELFEVEEGKAVVGMKVRKDMLNAAGVCQGGAIFSLADFAFAVASNSRGRLALAISANIYFISSAEEGEYLIACAKEVSVGRRLGVYEVEVREKETNRVVAKFTGEVYRKQEEVKV